MLFTLRTLFTVALAGVALTHGIGCGDGSSSAAPSLLQNAGAGAPSCDVVRGQLGQAMVAQYGYEALIQEMKQISRQISRIERRDLRSLVATIDAVGSDPQQSARSTHLIQAIYRSAIERSGLHADVPVTRPDLKRIVTATPTGFNPLFDGFTIVLTSAPLASSTPAKAGDITDAYLAVSADQAHYELILLRLTSVSAGVNGGSNTESEYVTVPQLVETQVPAGCKK